MDIRMTSSGMPLAGAVATKHPKVNPLSTVHCLLSPVPCPLSTAPSLPSIAARPIRAHLCYPWPKSPPNLPIA
jgi:hypothetical protein